MNVLSLSCVLSIVFHSFELDTKVFFPLRV